MEYIEWRGFKVNPENVPMARPGVYEFRCLVNGKPYIGISGVKTGVAGRCRRSRERGHGGPKFTNALRKYGTDTFVLTPLFYAIGEVDQKWLSKLEADLIVDNDSVKNGYNLQEASGAVGPYGEEFSAILREVLSRPEVKKKLSIASRINNARPEVKARQIAGINEANKRPEVKARRSATTLDSYATDPTRSIRQGQSIKATLARKTPEQRTKSAKKAWITRRANAAKRAMENQGD